MDRSVSSLLEWFRESVNQESSLWVSRGYNRSVGVSDSGGVPLRVLVSSQSEGKSLLRRTVSRVWENDNITWRTTSQCVPPAWACLMMTSSPCPRHAILLSQTHLKPTCPLQDHEVYMVSPSRCSNLDLPTPTPRLRPSFARPEASSSPAGKPSAVQHCTSPTAPSVAVYQLIPTQQRSLVVSIISTTAAISTTLATTSARTTSNKGDVHLAIRRFYFN